jgi:hypothetical protein
VAAAGAFAQQLLLLLLPVLLLLLLVPWGWVLLVAGAAWAAVQLAAKLQERAWPTHWALLWGLHWVRLQLLLQACGPKRWVCC